MWTNRGIAVLAAVLVASSIVTARAAVTIDTVPVGNTGNTADTAVQSGNSAGQGAVSYAYNIGKYEVTAGQYTAFLNAVGGVDTYALYNLTMSRTDYGSGITRSGGGTIGNPYTYTVNSAFTDRPVNYVSWGDAARFANWLANGQPTGAQGLATTEDGSYYLNGATSDAAIMAVTRKSGSTWFIPTEDEWYKAAYHKNDGNTGNYFAYPTSSNIMPSRDLLDPPPGNSANYRVATPRTPIDSGKYTTLAGEFQNSASPYGTFDQGGNVWEWNEANYASSSRGLRGGSFDSFSATLRGFTRDNTFPTNESDEWGFRVASVPEPGSIAVLLAAAGGLLIWRVRGK